MKLRLQLLIESDTGEIIRTEEVAQLERHSLRPEDVGLTLADAKQILGSMQEVMVLEQVATFLKEQSGCTNCGKALTRKGQHHLVFRTIFGTLRLSSPRLYSCSCQQGWHQPYPPGASAFGTHRARVGVFGDEVCSFAVLWFDGRRSQRDLAHRRCVEYEKCSPTCHAHGRTDGRRTR